MIQVAPHAAVLVWTLAAFVLAGLIVSAVATKRARNGGTLAAAIVAGATVVWVLPGLIVAAAVVLWFLVYRARAGRS